MISLILTILYLAKDTVHRWFTRISSPVARVLVVYFLTLSALAALGSYVITLDVVRHELIARGANTVVAALSAQNRDKPIFIPSYEAMEKALDAESYVFLACGMVSLPNGQSVQVYTYDFSRMRQMLPLMAPDGRPTLLQPEGESLLPLGPGDVIYNKTRIPVMVRSLPPDHTLQRISRYGALIVNPDRLPPQMTAGHLVSLIIRVHHLESSEAITRVERYIEMLKRYEKAFGSIVSAGSLLKRMDEVLSKQVQCRVAFCIGISAIVGILLTALAGMEYRQNEYIYTLMKSFGIHPMLLVGSFIVENLFIVACSFAAAIISFMYFQEIIVTQILKLGKYSLALGDIMQEIYLISYTLLGCVFISAIPIFVAAYREIGRVLK